MEKVAMSAQVSLSPAKKPLLLLACTAWEASPGGF
jgi:hypothetical protein